MREPADTETKEASGRYDLPLAAAYIRGALAGTDHPLITQPFDALDREMCEDLLALARERGIDLHHLKRFDELPRVRAVLGFLRGIRPAELLDIGSGRGAFLFPFLRAFPGTPVTSVEKDERRADMLDAVSRGGFDRLSAVRADICSWDAPDAAYDVVTMLEVLEHIPDVRSAVLNACRIARRYVAVTVPNKPDDNPEHIHLLTKPVLTGLFKAAGCADLKFDAVPGHLILFAKKGA